MPRTWSNDGTPALSAANLNALEAELLTSLWSAAALSTKTANYTATASDKVLIYNGSLITATLPDPTTVSGRIYLIKNIHTTVLTVVSAGTSKTIDGVASVPVFQNVTLTVVSDGTAWFALSGLELLATAANGVKAYASTSSSEPAFDANSSGVTGRSALRASTGSGTSYQLETGQNLSGTFTRMFAVNNSGSLTRLSNTDFTFAAKSNNPQDAIGASYGLVTDIAAGLTYLQRGTGTAFPRWNLQPLGYSGQPFTKTADYTVDFRDSLLIGNGTSITLTLPDPTSSGITGRKFEFKNINSTSLTIVSAGTSKTIDGAASKTLAQWEKMTVISDATQWLIVSS